MYCDERQHDRLEDDDLSETRVPIHKVSVMPYKVSIDLKVLNDAELIELVRETQEQIEAHGEWNELNVLLRDLTAELVKRRVLSRVQFVELMELSPPE
jgi:hypothetical protein